MFCPAAFAGNVEAKKGRKTIVKRSLLAGLALALAAVQPAAAWQLVAGASAGVFVQPSFQNPSSATLVFGPENLRESPELNWLYPAQVQAVVGDDFRYFLEMSATFDGSAWSGDWSIFYYANEGSRWPSDPFEPVRRDLVKGSFQTASFGLNSIGEIDFAADLLSDGEVTFPDGSTGQLSDYGITNQLLLTGNFRFTGEEFEDGDFAYGVVKLAVQPIPEPVFFQMGTLAALSGLGLLRLRRRS
jgi:hypothetical protein